MTQILHAIRSLGPIAVLGDNRIVMVSFQPQSSKRRCPGLELNRPSIFLIATKAVTSAMRWYTTPIITEMIGPVHFERPSHRLFYTKVTMIFRKVLLTSFVFNVFFIGGCRVQSSAEEFSEPRIETHYSPNENLEAFDNRLIRSAHRSVDICAFAFTDHELAEALIAVAARGVKVRLYLDQGQTHGELAREERGGRTSRAGGTEDDGAAQMDAGVMQRLSATPNIEIRIKHSRTLMHLKSYSIDGISLRSGSANFSPTGEKRQDNDLLLTRDRGSVERFRLNFEQLWSRADNESITPNSL